MRLPSRTQETFSIQTRPQVDPQPTFKPTHCTPTIVRQLHMVDLEMSPGFESEAALLVWVVGPGYKNSLKRGPES